MDVRRPGGAQRESVSSAAHSGRCGDAHAGISANARRSALWPPARERTQAASRTGAPAPDSPALRLRMVDHAIGSGMPYPSG